MGRGATMAELPDKAARRDQRGGREVTPAPTATGDLLVRQIETHEVKAQDPDPQRLMMTGEDGLGQVIEAPLAGRAAVALALSLPVIVTIPRHLVTPALRTAHTRGPAQTPDRVKALGVIDQELEVDQGVHCGRLLPA